MSLEELFSYFIFATSFLRIDSLSKLASSNCEIRKEVFNGTHRNFSAQYACEVIYMNYLTIVSLIKQRHQMSLEHSTKSEQSHLHLFFAFFLENAEISMGNGAIAFSEMFQEIFYKQQDKYIIKYLCRLFYKISIVKCK